MSRPEHPVGKTRAKAIWQLVLLAIVFFITPWIPGHAYAQEMAAPKRIRSERDRPERSYYALHFAANEKRLLKQAEDAIQDSNQTNHVDRNLKNAFTVQVVAWLYEDVGDFARAEPFYLQSLKIYKKAVNDSAPEYVNCQINLAGVYLQQGDYLRAEPLLMQAQATTQRKAGGDTSGYLKSLDHLAELYMQMGDYAKALPLYEQVVRLRKDTNGENSYLYGVALHNLGLLCERMHRYQEAESLLLEDLEITGKLFGKNRPPYAHSAETIALLYTNMGKYEQAASLFEEAVSIYEKTLGKEHPAYARTLSNFGFLCTRTGGYERGESLLTEAIRLRKKLLGPIHPDTADSLNDLAALYYVKGDNRRAAEASRESLLATRRIMEWTSKLQSERQQLAMVGMFRKRLNLYLSIANQAGLPAEDVYGELLAWKGSVFSRQQHLRLMRDNQELKPLFDALAHTTGRLATLVFSQSKRSNNIARQKQIDDISSEKERLETQLSQKSADFRNAKSCQMRSPLQVRQTLPAGVALVDFFEYTHFSPPKGSGTMEEEQRIVAFVVRADQPIAMVAIGPAAAIAETVDRWRDSINRGPADREDIDPGEKLRHLVWNPLEKHLKEAKTVLISPDGALNLLPFAALPGSKAGTYLIEQTAIAIVPVPQLIPELLAKRESIESDKTPPRMLLVGDVNFNASTDDSVKGSVEAKKSWHRRRAGTLQSFSPLDGTRVEILAIRDSFKNAVGTEPELLRGDKPTESTVRHDAPKYEYLHFATHGFFAPPNLPSQLAGKETSRESAAGSPLQKSEAVLHPGLLSGIALAGANKPGDDGDDGVLTALEVAELDLHKTELAVLSACETGLGKVAGGEGVLGLQRAFQIAGTKSVITSLWKVDDQATRKLMERFYENYWTREMGMLESLREAQLWMLRKGYQRGAVRLDQEQSMETASHTSPFYWSGFVLSGDWR